MTKACVILSIYKPNTVFFKKQLKSIDEQTYPNTELIIRNDCPDNKIDKKLINKCITSKKVKYLTDDLGNLGYTKSFERLVDSVEKDSYIAFCDQDDIWENNKLEVMINALENSHKSMCICDRKIIDGNDKIISEVKNSEKKIWNNFQDVINQAPFLAIAPGMSIVCKASFAKKNLPYYPFAFDKYLTCCAVFEDSLIKVDKSLVRYRRHGNNVSGVLNDIENKNDYYQKRVFQHDKLVKHLAKKYKNVDMKDIISFSEARVNKNIINLFKYRKVSPSQAKFEILLALTPDFIFKFLLKLKRGK